MPCFYWSRKRRHHVFISYPIILVCSHWSEHLISVRFSAFVRCMTPAQVHPLSLSALILFHVYPAPIALFRSLTSEFFPKQHTSLILRILLWKTINTLKYLAIQLLVVVLVPFSSIRLPHVFFSTSDCLFVAHQIYRVPGYFRFNLAIDRMLLNIILICILATERAHKLT